MTAADAYQDDQTDTMRAELSAMLDRLEGQEGGHPMTQMLDMLAGLSMERSTVIGHRFSGDRWWQIAQAVQLCATYCEHKTGD